MSAALFRSSLRSATAPVARSPVSLRQQPFSSASRPSFAPSGASPAGKPTGGPPEDPTHTGRVRIAASLAIAVTGAWLYFHNPYIEGEGKTPSTSELDLEHALKSSGSKSSN